MNPSPTLQELVDLELQLLGDRRRPLEELTKRDAAIRKRIGADDLDGRELYLAWLRDLRAGEPQSPGRRTVRALDWSTAGVTVLAAGAGIGAVSTWLTIGPAGLPVNVLSFWPVMVGLQALLAVLWVVAASGGGRLARIPGISRVTHALRKTAEALPAAASLLASVLLRAGDGDLAERWAELRSLDVIYGRLRFWLLTRIGQTAALSFNVAALAALLIIPYVHDPGFGWRSRNLSELDVFAAARAVSIPWSVMAPKATLSIEDVRETRYSSLAAHLEETFGTDPAQWAAWWPFLAASLALYAVAPRGCFVLLASAKVRMELRRASLDHVEYARLRERLHRPLVESRATNSEEQLIGDDETPVARDSVPDLDGRPTVVLRWSGIDLETRELVERVEKLLTSTVAEVLEVGAIDTAADLIALDALDSIREPAVVLVAEAWEPPVSDHLDLLAQIRERVGTGCPLVVALYGRDRRGRTIPAEPRQLDQWRRRLLRAADPWLRVASLASLGASP